jgi:hypothetical protein
MPEFLADHGNQRPWCAARKAVGMPEPQKVYGLPPSYGTPMALARAGKRGGQATLGTPCARRSDIHEEVFVKTGARRLRDFPDIHSASAAAAARHESVCGCPHSHQRRRSAPCRTPGCNLSPALDLDVEPSSDRSTAPGNRGQSSTVQYESSRSCYLAGVRPLALGQDRQPATKAGPVRRGQQCQPGRVQGRAVHERLPLSTRRMVPAGPTWQSLIRDHPSGRCFACSSSSARETRS